MRSHGSQSGFLIKVDALQPVVLRYLAWGASTSGVEQGFGKQQHTLGGLGTDRCEQLLNDHQDVVASNPGKQNDQELVSLARAEWAAVYGEVRASGSNNRAVRMDKGKSKRSRVKKMSMHKWVLALVVIPKRKHGKRKRRTSKRKPKRNQSADPFQNATKTQN